MNKKKGYGFIFFLIGLLVIAGIIIGYLVIRNNIKKKFDTLYNANQQITINYGIIEKENHLMEKNTLIRRVHQDNNYYLKITEDNHLFTYYLDTYYFFDPVKGYILDYEKKLEKDTAEKIIKEITEKEVANLNAKNESDYVFILKDHKESYIHKEDLKNILLKYNIIIKF